MLMNNKISSQTDDSHLTSGNTVVNKRISFRMVRSTFQPPQEAQNTLQTQSERKIVYPSYSKILMANKKFSVNDIQRKRSQQIDFNPSVEFINSLTSDNQIENFDEGDCIPINSDERWIVVSGTLKVIGINGSSFIKKQGFIFFASPQTKRRVKQVVAICPTTLYRIPYDIFKESIRSFLYVKNAEKVKYLKHCPFLGWGQSLAQDLAIAIDFISEIQKDTVIYKEGDEADCLYFVKEGIVLLQRTGKIGNNIILDYEKYYQVNYVNDEQGLIIVRKGMLFGADGILIKEVKPQTNLLQPANPQNLHLNEMEKYNQQQTNLKSTRIYSAKSIGKCQLYKIDKQVIETYLKSHNQIQHDGQIKMSNKQLDRICLQYTNLLMGSHQIAKQVKKKNLELKIKVNQQQVQQMDKKKKKIQIIKLSQKKLKKVASVEHRKNEYGKQPQQPFTLKKSNVNIDFLSKQKQKNTLSFPRLSRNYIQKLIMKKLQTKQHQQYLSYKKKIQNELFSKEGESSKIYEPHDAKKKQIKNKFKQKREGKKEIKKQDQKQDLQIMKVKSYRSLLSPLGAYNT